MTYNVFGGTNLNHVCSQYCEMIAESMSLSLSVMDSICKFCLATTALWHYTECCETVSQPLWVSIHPKNSG